MPGEDLDSDPLIYTIVFTTKHGVLTFFDNTTGNFTYIPDIGFVGTDVFTYLANDGYATSSIATGTINFVLNNPPVITVLGDNPLLVPVGGKYKDPFATAEDLEDGDITSTIVVTDNVDTNTVGTYQITYTSADIFGVSTSSTRIVIVYNLSDDIDKDGIINSIDPDVDGDGIINNIDDDIDGDGTENKIDNEDDGDGILDGEDATPNGLDAYDFDNDKIVNDLDLDLDGDGIINFYDADVDGDGLQNNIDSDDDNDGVLDNSDSTPHGFGSANDFDGDGILNVDDLDLDGDGILSSEDDDIDGDGLTNDIDTDDDGDGILDILDKNPKIYLAPGDELKKETNTTSSSGGGSVVPVVAGGGGANNFNYGLGTINLATSTGVVLGASIDLNTCGNYFDPKTIIGPGLKNRKEDVMLLQKFLNGELNFKLPITGYYGKLTQAAVKKFQLKYKKEILEPWGITEPTFFVYHTTIHQINSLMCPAHTGPLDQSKLIPLK